MTSYDISCIIITRVTRFNHIAFLCISIHLKDLMKKILIVATLILLLPLFGCLQPHVKSVEHLQSDYDRLQSLKTSLENDLIHAQDPAKVKDDLHEVELKMRYIEIEILKKQVEEN